MVWWPKVKITNYLNIGTSASKKAKPKLMAVEVQDNFEEKTSTILPRRSVIKHGTLKLSSKSDDSDTDSNSRANTEEIYVQVCKRIEKLTIELGQQRKSFNLPACDAFLKKHTTQQKGKEVMAVDIETIRYDRVPVIDVECKVRKHWKSLSWWVVIDGGVGVNIMSEVTQKQLGIHDMKHAPFRVRMANQRVVKPLGLIEGILLKVGGAKVKTIFQSWMLEC